MAKTDVVKHDLEPPNPADTIDWNNLEPVPLPVIPRLPSDHQPSVLFNPPVTTLVSATDLTKAPYRSVGKMWLLIDGKEKGASGWVVAGRAFITAGHCVYHPDFGGWITKAAFCPRYDDGCNKRYAGTAVYTLKGWTEDNDRAYDMAACVISEDFATSEPPLAFETGIFTPSKFAAIGYPITPIPRHQFNGKHMWQSVGAWLSEKDGIIVAENDLTNGASGGPWCDPEGNYLVYGLTAARTDIDGPFEARSPALANGFDNLYDAVKNL